jgi:hypothetical protein
MIKNNIAADPATLPAELDLAAIGDPPNGAIWRWAGLGLSLAMVAAILFKLTDIRLDGLFDVPASPLFWFCLAASYLATPASEWVIFRRLWKIPMEGFSALLKKQVTNELLLGYMGDAQFYLWARQRTTMTGAPFAAIKDVSILSAMAGNVATLILLLVGWPFLSEFAIGPHLRTIIGSIGVIIASSLVVFLFRQKLFSLPRPQLLFISAVHMARIAIGLILMASALQLLLPQVPLTEILLLAMFRMLISRLPLIPNKDLVFAAMTVFLIGTDPAIGAVVAKIALLTLVLHIVTGLTLAVIGRNEWKESNA